MARRREPERMCVLCRARVPKADLVRLHVVDGRLIATDDGTGQGRGAYLCRAEEAWMDDALPRRLGAALRHGAGAVTPASIETWRRRFAAGGPCARRAPAAAAESADGES